MIAKTIQDNLCKRLRSQGLPKELTYNILNIILKWIKNSGVEWTVDRLKSLHHYYIEFQANQKPISEFLASKKPEYLGIRSDGLPKGVFKNIWKITNMKTALNILSCHADFINEKLTKTQYDKFIKGISTETNISLEKFKDPSVDFVFAKTNKKLTRSTGYFTSLKRIGLSLEKKELIHLKKKEYRQYMAVKPSNDYVKDYHDLLELTYDSKPKIAKSVLHCPQDTFPDFSIITTRSVPAFDDIWTYKDNMHLPEVQALLKNVNPDKKDLQKTLNLDLPSKLVSSKRQRIYRVNDITDVAVAYAYSWYCVPKLTIDYIGEQYGYTYLPDGLLHNEIHELTYTDGLSLTLNQRMNLVGTIGIIQEKSLKARIVANPNKVTQFYLKPLGLKLYELLRSIPTDCTYDQEAGALWCQEMLEKKVVLSAVDLSSATDTLSVEASFKLIEKFFFQKDFDDVQNEPYYLDYSWIKARNYFLRLCKEGIWSVIDPQGNEQYVSYKQGQPMGTFPSFALLGLTNNIVATAAAIKNGFNPEDAFRVVGDDIVMRDEISKDYIELITSVGGQVNNFKTVTSSLLTEFTGGIITARKNIRKTSKTIKIDDNSFMSRLKSFGKKVIRFLLPKQRRVVTKKAMFIPGCAIDGPWSTEDFGIPLRLRLDYAYALCSKLEQRVKPDQRLLDSEQFTNFLYWSLKSKDRENLMAFCCPSFLYEDFQSSIFLEYASMHFDQIENGRTLLDSLSKNDLPDFDKFIKIKLKDEMSRLLSKQPRVKSIHDTYGINVPDLIEQMEDLENKEDLIPIGNILKDVNTIEQCLKKIEQSVKPLDQILLPNAIEFFETLGMKKEYTSFDTFNRQCLKWISEYKGKIYTENILLDYMNKYNQYLLTNISKGVTTDTLVNSLYSTLIDLKEESKEKQQLTEKFKLTNLYLCVVSFYFLSKPYIGYDDELSLRKYFEEFALKVFNHKLFPQFEEDIVHISKTLESFIEKRPYLKNFKWSRKILGSSYWGNHSLPFDNKFDAQFLKEKCCKFSHKTFKLQHPKSSSMGRPRERER